MKKTVTKKKVKAKKEAKINPRHELFIRHMTRPGAPTFNNATLSYACVFNPKMFKLSREKERDDEGNVIGESPYDKAYTSANANGARLIAIDSIRTRVNKRLVKIFSDDDEADARLATLAFQDTDGHLSLAALRDRNKLKKRLMDEPTLPPGSVPITKIEIVMPK